MLNHNLRAWQRLGLLCTQDTGDYLPQLSVLAPAFCATAKGQLPQGRATGIQAGGSDAACVMESLRALDAYDSLVTRLSLDNQVIFQLAPVA